MVFRNTMEKDILNENSLTGLNTTYFFKADDDDIVIMKF